MLHVSITSIHQCNGGEITHESFKVFPLSSFLGILLHLLIESNSFQKLQTAVGVFHMLNSYIDSLGDYSFPVS